MLLKEQIWTFKYEPTELDSMILHPDIRPKLEKALVDKPNMLLFGSAGVGKGTFTKIFLEKKLPIWKQQWLPSKTESLHQSR